MAIAEFKKEVAGFVSRSLTELVVDSQDLVLTAINNAKDFAQSMHNFNRAQRDGFLDLNPYGVSILAVNTTPAGGTTFIARMVDEVWRYITTGGKQEPSQRIAYYTKDQLKVELVDVTSPLTSNEIPLSRMIAYQKGIKLFLTGVTEDTTVMVDCTEWMPPYDDSTVLTDFFLVFHKNWLLPKSVNNLNMLLKEDERVLISDRLLNKEWDAVISSDESLEEAGTDVSLE